MWDDDGDDDDDDGEDGDDMEWGEERNEKRGLWRREVGGDREEGNCDSSFCIISATLVISWLKKKDARMKKN